ncbi:MAG TPA: STAS domain-containing protein [Spirochaetota bacterium]|nr:STAS domain-containing protein [Spirochaetota bacterium]
MLTIDSEVTGKLVVFTILGEISPSTSRDFDRAFEKYISPEYGVMAVDLKKIRYIDSFGISRLVRLSRSFAETGGEFLLVSMNENIRQLFRMATFDKMFKILTAEQFAAGYMNTGNNPAASPVNSSGRIKAEAVSGPAKTVRYKHNDITGTTLLFEDEEIKKSGK